MAMMKMAGKTDAGLAAGLSVSDEGYARTEKRWKVTTTTLCNVTVEDTTAFNTVDTPVDISGAAFVALHIFNPALVPFNVTLLEDVERGGVNPLYSVHGTPIMIRVSSARRSIITSDDLPVLAYIKYLKLLITPSEVPASPGIIKITVDVKE